MANVSFKTVPLLRRKTEELHRLRELPRLSGHIFVDGTYVNVERHGEVSVGVSENKLRIAVAVDDLGPCMTKVSGYGMPNDCDSEKDFYSMIERGSYVTHDDTNYAHTSLTATLSQP